MSPETPIAESERIALLPYTHADDGDMIACWQDAGTQRGFNAILGDDCKDFFAFEIDQFPFWVTVLDRKTGCKVGSLRLGLDEKCPDLAIWIYPAYRSMGYGRESFYLALKYLFERRGYTELAAGCYVDNEKSMRILKGLGFARVPGDDEESPNCFTGEPTTMLGFKITAEDFEKETAGETAIQCENVRGTPMPFSSVCTVGRHAHMPPPECSLEHSGETDCEPVCGPVRNDILTE